MYEFVCDWAPAQHVCQVEGCDQPHCCKCGCHYDSHGSDTCDACQSDRAVAECEAQVAAFGGNYEAAGAYFGW
jgi:hypothetical protein